MPLMFFLGGKVTSLLEMPRFALVERKYSFILSSRFSFEAYIDERQLKSLSRQNGLCGTVSMCVLRFLEALLDLNHFNYAWQLFRGRSITYIQFILASHSSGAFFVHLFPNEIHCLLFFVYNFLVITSETRSEALS